jgi:hypothetical protein
MKLLRVEKISFCHLHLRITTCCCRLKRVFIYHKIATPQQTQRTTLHSIYQTMSETEAAAAAAAPAATDAPKKKGGAGGKKKTEKATKEPERRSSRAKKAPAADTMTAPAVKAAA